MFWLDWVNGDLEVRQAAALYRAQPCCTAGIGIWGAAACRILLDKTLMYCLYWNLRCGRLPHFVGQNSDVLLVLEFEVRQPAALCLYTQAHHCPSQVRCVESGLSVRQTKFLHKKCGRTSNS